MSTRFLGQKHRDMRRRHAISSVFSGHNQDLDISSLKGHDSACNIILILSVGGAEHRAQLRARDRHHRETKFHVVASWAGMLGLNRNTTIVQLVLEYKLCGNVNTMSSCDQNHLSDKSLCPCFVHTESPATFNAREPLIILELKSARSLRFSVYVT